MRTRVRLITENDRLRQKMRLCLAGVCDIVSDGSAGFTLTEVAAPGEGGYLRIEGEGCPVVCLSLPFSHRALIDALSGRAGTVRRISAVAGESAVTLDGEKIRLTDLEYRLFLAIAAGGGEFVSREDLLREVWGEGAPGGVLNVYIHYLREKLERGGEKIILSSRLSGYRINEKFVGGGNE